MWGEIFNTPPPTHILVMTFQVEGVKFFWFENFDNNFLKLKPIDYFKLFQNLDAYNKSRVTNSHKWHDNITNCSRSLYILELGRYLKKLNTRTRYCFQYHLKPFQNIKKNDIHSNVLTPKSQKYVIQSNNIQNDFLK